MLHENVPSFDPSILEMLMSDEYAVQSIVFDAAVLGHPCHRERRLTWLIHKKLVVVGVPSSMPTWSLASIESFFRILECTYHIYAVASDDDLEEELRWCEDRSLSQCCVAEADRILAEGYEHLPAGIVSSR